MTEKEKENAIRCLRLWIKREPQIQTYKTCLEALEQEPYEDVIINKNYWKGFNNGIRTEKFRENKRQQPCGDCISRQAALDLCERFDGGVPYSVLSNYDMLPPVTPQSKMGRWIIVDDCEKFIAKCSECGRIEDSRMISKYPYCHCGTKMREVEE